MRDSDIGIYMENETLGNFARNTAQSLETDGTVRGESCAAAVQAVLRGLKRSLEAIPAGSRASPPPLPFGPPRACPGAPGRTGPWSPRPPAP